MHASERAQDGLRSLKQSVLMVLWHDPQGLRTDEIANILAGESGPPDNHTYALYRSVIHMLLKEQLIRKVGKRYVLNDLESTDILFQFAYDSSLSLQQQIRHLLRVAREFGHEEVVAAALAEAAVLLSVSPNGSKLEISPWDESAGPNGRSFKINDTVFRVFVKPLYNAFKICIEDLKAGLAPHALVPERFSSTARESAESIAPGRITVTSFEEFISEIVADRAGHTSVSILHHFAQLLSHYNDRVGALMREEPLRINVPLDLPPLPSAVASETPGPAI